MSKLSAIAALALVSVLGGAACKDAPGGAAGASSATPAATGASSAAPAAPGQVSCDAVLTKLESIGKMDAAGKKILRAMCEGESQPVRACMLAASTMNDVDACDPHPFKTKDAPEPAAGDLVDLDLSTADPAWKGWVARGPKDAKVLADGVHGARIAATGMNAFDISFGPSKTRLADTRKGAEAGQKAMGSASKTTFLLDTADKLEWTTEVGASKSWRFSWNVKASGKDVTCSTGMMGAATETMVALLKASCASLRKK